MPKTNAKIELTANPEPGATITIRIAEGYVAMLEPVVPLLLPHLETTVISFQPGGPTGIRRGKEPFPFGALDSNRLFFPAGLVPRVRTVLEANGYRVSIEDPRRPGRRLTLSDEERAALTPRQNLLVELIRKEPLGQIQVRGPREAFETCVEIIRAFPRARIAVVLASRRAARKLWWDLEKRLSERVSLRISGTDRRGSRILVSTFGQLDRWTTGKWEMLLLPSPADAVSQQAGRKLVELKFPRIYALIAADQRPDRRTDQILEAIAGPVILRLGGSAPAIRATLLSPPPGTIENGETFLERKRAMVWHNPARNDFLARVSRAIGARDRTALRALGVRRRDLRLPAGTDPLRVIVLVESTEHGRWLSPLLPGWKMHDAVARSRSPATTPNGAIPCLVGPAIVTIARAALSALRADVVVLASGRVESLDLAGAPGSEADDGAAHPITLIDLDDRFDRQAAENSGRRILEYQRRGIDVIRIGDGNRAT
jgi:hypothetical protein